MPAFVCLYNTKREALPPLCWPGRRDAGRKHILQFGIVQDTVIVLVASMEQLREEIVTHLAEFTGVRLEFRPFHPIIYYR